MKKKLSKAQAELMKLIYEGATLKVTRPELLPILVLKGGYVSSVKIATLNKLIALGLLVSTFKRDSNSNSNWLVSLTAQGRKDKREYLLTLPQAKEDTKKQSQ